VKQSGVVTWVGIARVPERLPPSYHVAENSAPQVDVGLHILIILLETCPFADGILQGTAALEFGKEACIKAQ
jgi:hypothetical protein